MFALLMLDLIIIEPGLQWSQTLQYTRVFLIIGVIRCNMYIKLILKSR